MFINDPLVEAREHSSRLRAEASAEHLRAPVTRRLLAGALRHMADRLHPGTLVPPLTSPQNRPATSSTP
jgi:hypothetical protein